MFQYKLVELDHHFEIWKTYESHDELYGCYTSLFHAFFDVSQDNHFIGFF
jgi:hypothetical protein